MAGWMGIKGWMGGLAGVSGWVCRVAVVEGHRVGGGGVGVMLGCDLKAILVLCLL